MAGFKKLLAAAEASLHFLIPFVVVTLAALVLWVLRELATSNDYAKLGFNVVFLAAAGFGGWKLYERLVTMEIKGTNVVSEKEEASARDVEAELLAQEEAEKAARGAKKAAKEAKKAGSAPRPATPVVAPVTTAASTKKKAVKSRADSSDDDDDLLAAAAFANIKGIKRQADGKAK